MAARLQEFYRKEVVPALMKQLGVANPMAVPRITKVTINMGVGEALADRKVLDSATAGDNVGLLLKDLGKEQLHTGDLIQG